MPSSVIRVAPGIWRYRFGEPELHTPTRFRSGPVQTAGLAALPAAAKAPIAARDVRFERSARGCSVLLPLEPDEGIYGLGLSTRVFEKSGKRQKLVPSDAPEDPAGPSHAPVPFYVSTAGYGVYLDTARFATFHVGNVAPVEESGAGGEGGMAGSVADLYKARALKVRHMLVEIPAAQGVDAYLFAGPAMADAVRRYVLFSGGGAVPPLWGLGVVYRGKSDFTQEDCLRLGRSFREQHIPCDMFGLEPGWQTKSYSSSFVWDTSRFPDPDAYIREMRALGYHLSVWEHAFTHPESPIHEALRPHSGSYRVWGGLVPDFAAPAARRIFEAHHARTLFDRGVDAVKLDECDYQPFGPEPWSFPESTRFPSGLDGEQMHSLFGLLYQQTMMAPLTAANRRTWGLVRNSGSLAAPLPYVVYSDSYDHRCYVRGLVNQGFCGLLWTPEVRDSSTLEELYRRVQTVIFAPQTLINPWYMKLPPWQQINAEKSNRGEVMPEAPAATAIIRRLLELRMSLTPYLYAAFNEYRRSGTPPIRALVMDWPNDAAVRTIDDQFMFGPSILVAPMFAGQASRQVYLPRGRWCDLWTNEIVAGGRSIEVAKPYDQVPLFVRENAIVPLAAPVEHIGADTCFELEVRVYGASPAPFTLFEDDGASNDYLQGKQSTLRLSWDGAVGRAERTGAYTGPARHHVARWTAIGGFERVAMPLLANGGFADNARDFAVENCTGYVSQCKPIVGWAASDPARVGVQPLVNGLRNMGPASVPPNTHFAFIQMAGTALRQAPDGLKPGVRYRLTFHLAARNYAEASSPNEQRIAISVTGSERRELARAEHVGSTEAFTPGELVFVASGSRAAIEITNASAPGESTVCITEMTLTEI